MCLHTHTRTEVTREKTVYNVLSLMYKETTPERCNKVAPPMAFRQYTVRNSKQADKNTAEATDSS